MYTFCNFHIFFFLTISVIQYFFLLLFNLLLLFWEKLCGSTYLLFLFSTKYLFESRLSDKTRVRKSVETEAPFTEDCLDFFFFHVNRNFILELIKLILFAVPVREIGHSRVSFDIFVFEIISFFLFKIVLLLGKFLGVRLWCIIFLLNKIFFYLGIFHRIDCLSWTFAKGEGTAFWLNDFACLFYIFSVLLR